jgi:D-hydroxyproline dehydrogenase subunit alpha
MSEHVTHKCDVLVVGAGPAGIAAAVTAAERGRRVLLVDDNAAPGGQIWRSQTTGANKREYDQTALIWLDRLRASRVMFSLHTRVVAIATGGEVICERNSECIRVSYDSLILATGARELFLPFPGWTLPNVMGAGGLQAMVKSGLPVAGKRVVVAGSGPLLLAVASTLQEQGAVVKGIFEQTSLKHLCGFGFSLLRRPGAILEALRYGLNIGVGKYHVGWWPKHAEGKPNLKAVVVTNGTRQQRIACDYLACGFHLIPNTELSVLLGCEVRDGHVVVDALQQTSVKRIYSAGEATGVGGLELALLEGEIAGLSATGRERETSRLQVTRRRYQTGVARMNVAFALRNELRAMTTDSTIVCRCEDVSWQAIRFRSSLRSAKLYTRCSMGPCQGRICGPALRFLTGWDSDRLRPPLYPVLVSTLLPSAASNREKI